MKLHNMLKVNKDEIARFLKTNPEALNEFEKQYESICEDNDSDCFFKMNNKTAASAKRGINMEDTELLYDIIPRIVEELVSQTIVIGEKHDKFLQNELVTKEELMSLPESIRPELTGTLVKKDIKEPSYLFLTDVYLRYKTSENKREKQTLYNQFRQGLDILDYDSVMYEMIDTNPNSMSHWFPQISKAAEVDDFFKIPQTTIIKVPLPILQLTRNDYMSLHRSTLDIVNEFCKEVFRLDKTKDYFIKTGTFSSKFDFRNVKVSGEKEISEIGEYLLFIHFQANQMASMFSSPSIYGVSTTTEWVVREFIEDKENNPCIYHGMPLHTEYRIFADFDTKEILGITPYWRSDVMKKRLGSASDKNDPDKIHDYIIYSSYEDTLIKRYEENKQMVYEKAKTLIEDTNGLSGQWSIDIMQNGDDFWLIDMALAKDSALNDCISDNKLIAVEEDWMPKLAKREFI